MASCFPNNDVLLRFQAETPGAETRSETPAVIFAMCCGNRCDFNYYAAHRRVTDAPPPPPPPLVVITAHLPCGCMLKRLIPLQERHSGWQLLRSHFVPLAVTRVYHRRTSLRPPTYAPQRLCHRH